MLMENTQLNNMLLLCLNVSEGIMESNEEWKARKETVGRSDMEENQERWKYTYFPFSPLLYYFLMLCLDPHALY